jgi:hypothetical protein
MIQAAVSKSLPVANLSPPYLSSGAAAIKLSLRKSINCLKKNLNTKLSMHILVFLMIFGCDSFIWLISWGTSETDVQTVSHAVKQAGRQTDKRNGSTDRQTDSQPNRQADKQTKGVGALTDRQTDIHTGIESQKYKQAH